MNKTLSNVDINKIINFEANVLTHNDLNKYKNIFEVFENKPAFLLLYEYENRNGHWTCVIQHPLSKTIEFFDPYGDKPDSMRKYIPKNNWITERLSQMLYEARLMGWNIEYNEVPLQKTGKNINTCGRWCAVRIYYRNLPLKTFQNYFKKFPKNERDKVIVKVSDSLWQH